MIATLQGDLGSVQRQLDTSSQNCVVITHDLDTERRAHTELKVRGHVHSNIDIQILHLTKESCKFIILRIFIK